VKQQVNAAIGPPGVIGDSAWGKIGRGTWETRLGGSVDSGTNFEEDFEDFSYGFRPGRSAHQHPNNLRA